MSSWAELSDPDVDREAVVRPFRRPERRRTPAPPPEMVGPVRPLTDEERAERERALRLPPSTIAANLAHLDEIRRTLTGGHTVEAHP